jgi:hypothetical protein
MWPWRRHERAWAIRPRVAYAAGVALIILSGWFAAELFLGTRAGLAERVISAADVLWPLIVAINLRRTPATARGSGAF